MKEILKRLKDLESFIDKQRKFNEIQLKINEQLLQTSNDEFNYLEELCEHQKNPAN